jgi:hypothetical protein
MYAQKVRDLVNVVFDSRCVSNFLPVSCPISLERKGIPDLWDDRSVSIKADGVRIILVVQTGYVFTVDRSMSVEIIFDGPKTVDGLWVFDCELCTVGTKRVLYLFDTLVMAGRPITHYPYTVRYSANARYVREYSTGPPQYLQTPGIIPWSASHEIRLHDDLSMVVKQIYHMNLFDISVMGHVPYANDGLVFTKLHSPYEYGTSKSTIKWKGRSHITIDVRLIHTDLLTSDVDTTSPIHDIDPKFLTTSGTFAMVTGHMYGKSRLFAYLDTDMNIQDKHVYECYFDSIRWKVCGERHDKAFPNSITTIVATCKDMVDSVQLSDIFTRQHSDTMLPHRSQKN